MIAVSFSTIRKFPLFEDSQVASKWVINNSTEERQRNRRNQEKLRYGNRDGD